MVTRACLTLGLPRTALGVCATPNGLVWGCIQWDANAPMTLAERLIPDPTRVAHLTSPAAWVLVVEKHAVYQTLRSIGFLDLGPRYGVDAPGALVTGKGYPDQATRSLLKRWAGLPHAPQLFFLMDADPHGVDIVRTYMKALEGVDAHWIGLHVRQWLALRARDAFPTLMLKAGDRSKAQHLLDDANLPERLRHELAHQLHAGYKCELEVLCTSPADASGVLAEFVYAHIRAYLPSCGASHGTRSQPRPSPASRRRAHPSGDGGSPSGGSRRCTPRRAPGPAAG